MNTTPKLESTTRYSIFTPNHGQRSIDGGHVTKLAADMKAKGFNPSKPLTVVKDGKRLSIIDGHHRLEAAKKSAVPVYFVTVSSNGIIPLNVLQRGWKGKDYLMHYVRKGLPEYIKLYRLVEDHNLGLALTTALASGVVGISLSGGSATSGSRNIALAFKNGSYKVQTEDLVVTVSAFAKAVSKLDSKLVSRSLLSAFSKCLKIKGFEIERMLTGVKSAGKAKISSHNSTEGHLDELESIYNFKRTNTIPLAFLAKKKI